MRVKNKRNIQVPITYLSTTTSIFSWHTKLHSCDDRTMQGPGVSSLRIESKPNSDGKTRASPSTNYAQIYA